MTYLLHECLQKSAERAPDTVAVVDGERSLTYAELDGLTNRLANLLVERGVRKGDRVGLYIRKSLEAVVGVYGILKAGCAYVPLDPEAPVERLAYIIGNCGIEHVVTGADRNEAWSELAARSPGLRSFIVLDAADPLPTAPTSVDVLTAAAVEQQAGDRPRVTVIDRDLGIILYTSGSTGQPKGVMLSHENVMNFVCWAVQEFEVGESDRLSQIAPLHFDLSTFDIYGAALAGASVHLAPRQATMFPMQMRRFLEEHEITVMYAVPSVLTMLVERAKLEVGSLPALRTILFAGEVFPSKFLSRIMRVLPDVEFANLYGPTETNVCTYYRVTEPPSEEDPPISIGAAIDNLETFVVGPDGSVLPPGEVGELYVRGASVMLGYWGDPERTARTRVPNPFVEGLDDPVYRTGDLVREEPDGNYTFLGRRDNQIKSRGYRIELGDIEAAIYRHPDVVECAVVAIPDEQITNRLKAFIATETDLGLHELVSSLSQHLPKYMIPGEFEFRSALPKTTTGKIDRQALTQSAIQENQ